MMIRSILAVAAGLLCSAAGLRHGRDLQAVYQRLQRWVELLRHLALLVREGAGSLPDVLIASAGEALLPDAILRRLAEDMRAQPLCRPEELADFSALTEKERAPLQRLMRRLSRGSRESRFQALQDCADEMALLADAARDKAQTDARMWRQLSLLMGACLTLWLI